MKLRFSNAHFSVKHRKPFKNSFCPSRRHRRQTASRCLANFLFSLPQTLKNSVWHSQSRLRSKSNSAALWRTAAVVRNRRDVANHHDMQSCGGQRAHRGLASGARAFHFHFHALHPVLVARDACGRQRSLLRGVRRAFTRTFEADSTSGRPAHHAAIRVRDGDLRVVERRGDVHVTVRHHATLALLLEFLLALRCRCRLCRCPGIRCSSCGLWFFCHVLLQSFCARSETLPSWGAAALPLQTLSPSCRRSSSSPPLRRAADLYACAHSCACAGRVPEDSGDGECRDTLEFQSAGGCSSGSLCGDRLPPGLPA